MHKIVEYFKPKHSDKAVFLTWCVVCGSIGSGKTSTVKYLVSQINKEWDELQQENLYIYYLESLKKLKQDIRERLRKAKVINLVIDDAGFGLSSRRYKADTTALWFWIRHHFEEKIGCKNATLNVFYCIQKFTALQNIARNCPLLLFKANIIRDYQEWKTITRLTWAKQRARMLNEWSNEIYLRGNIEYAGKTLIVRLTDRPYIQTLPKPPQVDFIRVDSPDGIAGEENRYICLKCRKKSTSAAREPRCKHCNTRKVIEL